AAPDPAELEEAARQRGSERSGDMQLTLAPVEAAADDGAPLCLELGEIDAQGCATSIRLGPEGVVAVLSNDDSLALEGCAGRDAEAAGEMVVARARRADQLALRRLAQRPHRRLRGDAGERFDCIRHCRVGEAEVAVPS